MNLYNAFKACDLQLATSLLEAGSNANGEIENGENEQCFCLLFGWTPIHEACTTGDIEMAELLELAMVKLLFMWPKELELGVLTIFCQSMNRSFVVEQNFKDR